MIEPEMAFYDLNDNMDLAEEFIQNVIKHTYEKCKDDIIFLSNRLEKKKFPSQKIKEVSFHLLKGSSL